MTDRTIEILIERAEEFLADNTGQEQGEWNDGSDIRACELVEDLLNQLNKAGAK